MLQKRVQRTFDLLFVFGLFFLANVSAFYSSASWLVPPLVLAESIFWLMLAAISLWILYRHNLLLKFFAYLKRNWIIFPFLIFSGLSIFWSIYWQVSLYRWLILLCTIITGGYIGLRYDIKTIIKLLSIFGFYILFLSLLFVIFMPSIGVMNYYNIQGAWRGIYWHKNHMGLIATFVNILFLINLIDSVPSRKKKDIFLWGLLYGFSLFFVYQTDSVAAYITTLGLHGVILLALLWLKFRKYLRKSHYLIFIAVLILAALIVSFNADRFFGIFNRSTNLTGRVPMWTYLFNTYFSKRPWGGYGFNAFWYLEFHRVDLQRAAGYPDVIVISDNGFIDLLINTGYCGLIAFLILYLGIWWRSFQYAGKAADINGIFPVILMVFTLLANVSWSLIFENECFFMLMMISVLACISDSAPKEA